MRINKLSSVYRLESNGKSIKAEVSNNGEITLIADNGDDVFMFKNSSKKMVLAIGEMIVEASRL